MTLPSLCWTPNQLSCFPWGGTARSWYPTASPSIRLYAWPTVEVWLAAHPEPRYACAWAPYGGQWVLDLGDNHFGVVSLRTHDVNQHHTLGFHHGCITVRRRTNQSIATSAFHPFAATGATDGSVKLTNVLSAAKRKSAEDGSRVMHPLGRWQCTAPNTYHLHDALLPEGVWPQKQTKTPPPLWNEWDPSIAVTSLAYSPNAGRAMLLASGIAAGLVRVDWIVSS